MLGGPKELRIMTYNIHQCRGEDGKSSPIRIADVIQAHHPDILGLQEVGSASNEGIGFSNQALRIARSLGMHCDYFPAAPKNTNDMGIAILSRFPMKRMFARALPRLHGETDLITRNVLWVEVMIKTKKIQVINVHLSLRQRESLAQIDWLLSEKSTGQAAQRGPVVLLGDFNTSPSMQAYNRISRQFRDVLSEVRNAGEGNTWPSHRPRIRTDYIFVGESFSVRDAKIPHSATEKAASDHLPLIATLNFSKQNQPRQMDVVEAGGPERKAA